MSRGQLLYNPGLIHLDYGTLFDTKQIGEGELDHGWKIDGVERNFSIGKVSIQGKTHEDDPELLSGTTWIERRKKLAVALGLDMTNPEEAQKLSAFMSVFNQAALGVIPNEVKALLGEEARMTWTDTRYDVSYKQGKFLVKVTQLGNLYKNEDDQTAALEAEQMAEKQAKKHRTSYTKPVGAISASCVLEFNPKIRAFSLVDGIAFDKKFTKFIENKFAVDSSIPLYARMDWFKSRQISHALENKDHRVFVKEYADFLKQVQQSGVTISEQDRKLLLEAGLESAVIECSQGIDKEVFERVLDDYCNQFDAAFPAAQYDRAAIKQELTEPFMALMALYKDSVNQNVDSAAIKKKFNAVKATLKDHGKMLTKVCDSMRDSLIASNIERQAAEELAKPLAVAAPLAPQVEKSDTLADLEKPLAVASSDQKPKSIKTSVKLLLASFIKLFITKSPTQTKSFLSRLLERFTRSSTKTNIKVTNSADTDSALGNSRSGSPTPSDISVDSAAEAGKASRRPSFVDEARVAVDKVKAAEVSHTPEDDPRRHFNHKRG